MAVGRVGRAERFDSRKARVAAVFGTNERVLRQVYGIFELLEMAWHDCYSEISPPEDVVDDVLLCSEGTIEGLVEAAHLAVIDWRDIKLAAAELRSTASGQG